MSLIPTLGAFGCGPVGQQTPTWPGQSHQWYERAQVSLRSLDLDDATSAIDRALQAHPASVEIRLLAAEIAIAELDTTRVLEVLQNVPGPEASALRARAHWYSGQVTEAADELDLLLAEPSVRDPWAEQAVKLARQGRGRTPLRVTGGLLAVTEMPHTGMDALIVPLELNGEPALAMIDTSRPEAVVDAASGGEPAWVSLRFGGRVEVKDVPAFKADLSGLSREVNAPIKMLLGVHILRHLNATFDFRGSQFVVRTFPAPPPPHATTLHVAYVHGEKMAVTGSLADSQPASALQINTRIRYPVALDEEAWRSAGVDPATLQPVPGAAGMKAGSVPTLTLGAFSIPDVPGVSGAAVQYDSAPEIDWGGSLGAGLWAAFRVTLADDGRTLWLEDIGYGAGQAALEAGDPATEDPLPEAPSELQLQPPMGVE